MRNRIVLCGVLALAFGLWGCASDVGEHGASLHEVDARALTSQVLYIVPGSEIPLTLADLEAQGIDQSLATPVRVEILDSVAVAWLAPEGVGIITRENIVALWTVMEREPISDEIAPDEEISVSEPGELPALTTPTIDGEAPNVRPLLRPAEVTDLDNPVAETIIDFVDQVGSFEEAWMMAEVAESHPGCI